jgi:hypothetical protein
VSSSKFTPEELRGFALLKRLPAKTLDPLAVRLDRLSDAYHAPQCPPVEIREEEGSFFLTKLRPAYSRPVLPVIEKEPEHHRWHDLARQIDGVLREISGLKLGYASDGGPTGGFIAWAIEKITDETVEPGTIARALRRPRRRPRKQSGQT